MATQILLLAAHFCFPLAAIAQEPKHGGEADAKEWTAGKLIYNRMCISCHGEQGEGVDGQGVPPLVGDFTVSELAKVVHETMPEGEPETCVDEDARAVASYMHQAFYSLDAQNRRNPPKKTFSRLTANQLRQSVSDLYAHFGAVPDIKLERGVSARYFDGDKFKKENEKIARTDPTIDFDFGKESPGEGIKPEAFYLYWEGSLAPQKSGRYEIVVESTCSFKMSFGKLDRVFIDNHVQSGDRTEFRQSVFLIAGRIYPFKIDFIQRARKTELPPAKIRLAWVPPGGVEEVIPRQCLIPSPGPATFVLQSQLPPDDRSYGFERGVAINKQWDESTTAAAVEFANVSAAELYPRYLKANKDKANDQRQLLKGFLHELLSVAFRGPLEEDIAKIYVDHQVDITPDDSEAIKRVVLLGLKSPRFLYPLVDADKSVSQRVANRLALTIFDSLPSDEWMIRRIEKNEMQTEEQVRAAAGRMVRDHRGQAKMREMILEWLNLNQLPEIAKSSEIFPGFDAKLVQDLKSSLLAQVDAIVFEESSDFRQLFQADWSFTNERISNFYGEAWLPTDPSDKHLQRTRNPDSSRKGVLTHPLLMSGLAYHDTTSPIHRGVFLIRYVLGRTLRPPSEAFSPISPDLHPNLTTRERVALQTSPENCQACHVKINALGFVLENYDAVGRYRDSEREKPIDASGAYLERSDRLSQFSNATDLANYLTQSPDAHRAFVNKAFQHLVKQPPDAFGPDTLKKLTEKFAESRYNIRELFIEIAVIASLPSSD